MLQGGLAGSGPEMKPILLTNALMRESHIIALHMRFRTWWKLHPNRHTTTSQFVIICLIWHQLDYWNKVQTSQTCGRNRGWYFWWNGYWKYISTFALALLGWKTGLRFRMKLRFMVNLKFRMNLCPKLQMLVFVCWRQDQEDESASTSVRPNFGRAKIFRPK